MLSQTFLLWVRFLAVLLQLKHLCSVIDRRRRRLLASRRQQLAQRIVHPLCIFAADNHVREKALMAPALFQQRLRTPNVGWLLETISLSNQALSIFVHEPKSSEIAHRDGRSTMINLLCSSTDCFKNSWHS